MYRATTPTFRFKFPKALDMTEATDIKVTFEKPDGTTLLTKEMTDVEVEENYVYVYLTQSETLSFPLGAASAMVNWLYGDDKRMCSDPYEFTVKRNFIEEVL